MLPDSHDGFQYTIPQWRWDRCVNYFSPLPEERNNNSSGYLLFLRYFSQWKALIFGSLMNGKVTIDLLSSEFNNVFLCRGKSSNQPQLTERKSLKLIFWQRLSLGLLKNYSVWGGEIVVWKLRWIFGDAHNVQTSYYTTFDGTYSNSHPLLRTYMLFTSQEVHIESENLRPIEVLKSELTRYRYTGLS